jgi:hypothetical protein
MLPAGTERAASSFLKYSVSQILNDINLFIAGTRTFQRYFTYLLSA